MVQLTQAGFCLVQLAALFPKRPVGLDVPILGGVGYKLLLMGFHIGEDPLDIAQHQLFQNAFADIVGGADLTGSDAVAITTAGVSVLAFQCTRALLEIHLVAAVSAEQEAGEQINLLTFGRAVLRGDPLLGLPASFLTCRTPCTFSPLPYAPDIPFSTGYHRGSCPASYRCSSDAAADDGSSRYGDSEAR